jgi:uncharacterized protein YaaR (DUF327 family)
MINLPHFDRIKSLDAEHRKKDTRVKPVPQENFADQLNESIVKQIRQELDESYDQVRLHATNLIANPTSETYESYKTAVSKLLSHLQQIEQQLQRDIKINQTKLKQIQNTLGNIEKTLQKPHPDNKEIVTSQTHTLFRLAENIFLY